MREKRVGFADEGIQKAFLELKRGKGAEQELCGFLEKAFDKLEIDPFCGKKMQKKLWPREYMQKYRITNLWKYDLPNSWRLIYTVKADRATILSVVLEWFCHKEYERRFRY